MADSKEQEIRAQLEKYYQGAELDEKIRDVLRLGDPERRMRLQKPLLMELAKIADRYRMLTALTGDPLTPSDLSDALTTMLAAHVHSTVDKRMEPGFIALQISSVLAEKIMALFAKPVAGGKEAGRA